MNVEQRQEIERRLIQHLCLAMRQAGWIPVAVNDGEEIVNCENDEEVFDTVFSVDESAITFKRDRVRHKVVVVLGNDGYDAIADHSYSENDDFAKVMKEVVDPFADRLEEEGLGAVSPLVRAAGDYYAEPSSWGGEHRVMFQPSDENAPAVRIATFINLDDARLFASLKNGG